MIYFNGTYKQYVDESVNGKANPEMPFLSSRIGQDSFCGGASWDEAVQYATFGDIKRAEKIQQAVLNTANAVRMCLPRYDIQYVIEDGAYVDVARFLDGEPECFGKFVPSGNTLAKELSIAVNMSFHAGVDGNDIMNYGAKMAGIMLGLRSAGIRTKLYLYYAIDGGSGRKKVGQEVIDCSQCDVAEIASAFTAYFKRRIGFAWRENQSTQYINDFRINEGYGCSVEVKCEVSTDICFEKSEGMLHKSERELIAIVERKLKEVK